MIGRSMAVAKRTKKKMKRISDKNNHLNFKHTGTKHGENGDRTVQQNYANYFRYQSDQIKSYM